MPSTPDDLARRIRDYYGPMTDESYLRGWSASSLGIHFGLDGDGVTTHDESLTQTNRYLADALEIAPGARCLDAGCGVGGTSIWVARERQARVVGISLVEGQIEHARRFAAERGVEARAEFLVADYATTPFAPESFDAIWTLESLCHASDPGATLRHLFGLLRPGGRYACLDLFRGDGSSPEGLAALCEGWVLPALMTRTEIADALRAAGFVDVVERDETPRVLRSAATLIGMASARKRLLDMERIFTGRCDAVYEGHTRAALACARGFYDGSVTYGLVTGTKAAER